MLASIDVGRLSVPRPSPTRQRAAVRGVHQEGTSLLMVEQNAQKALNVGQRGYILEGGKVKLEGEAAVLLKNEEVINHFLGV